MHYANRVKTLTKKRKKEFTMNGRKLIGLLFVGLATMSSGCDSSRPKVKLEGQGDSSVAGKNASLGRSVDLIGLWLGKATLDRTSFSQDLATIKDADERNRIEEMAKAFESIAIGLEFRSDATMEVEIEILPPNSEPIRESSVTNWKIVSSDASSITILCSEKLDDGQLEEQTLRYEISSDRNHLTTIAPIGPELQSFQPRFEFERRIETNIADGPTIEPTVLR